MTYREAVARLTGLRGGEMAGMAPGLERIEALLSAIGNPERSFRIVQVAGTNGKGSVCAMLAAIFQAAGRRVGLYTSPHLVDIAERIRVDGRPIPEADLVDGVEAIGTLVARLDATMFDAVTALGLDHFAREAVDVAVLEVGMGGRLDSTTVGVPEAQVVTHIDYDHQAYLGATLSAIASEKAAIIRSGVAFSSRQAPEAMAVIERRAREVGVPLLVEGRDLAASVRGVTLDGQRLDLSGPGWRLDDVPCRLLGTFQPGHAVLAAAVTRHLGADEGAIRRGLATVEWPGRFQIVAREPIVILDGAHNPDGARALARSLAEYFPGQAVTLVIGISADKDLRAILAALAPSAVRLILTAYSSARAASPAELARYLPPGDCRVEVAASPREALAMALAGPRTPIICVAGSLFLIGEVLAQLPEKQQDFLAAFGPADSMRDHADHSTGAICFANPLSPRLAASRSATPVAALAAPTRLAHLARVSISARLAYGCGSPNLTYASGCQRARALPSCSQLAPVPGAKLTYCVALAALLLAVFLSGAPVAWAQARGPVIISDAGQESSIVADQIQQVGGPNDLLVATGNVEITQGATRLLADRVELNRDTGEVVAQGKVVFFDGQDRLVGDRVDYNLKTGTGIVHKGSTSTAPYYHLSGERMERVGEGIYQVRRGTFTTCEGDDPVWSFKFGSSTADLNEALYGTGAAFWVWNIPIIPFVPFFGVAIRRERQTGFLFPEFGSSNAKGAFLKVPFFWAISDSQDLTVGLDTYTRRGVGGDAEYRYIMSERARGSASGFLIPEFLRPEEDRERLGIPLWRGLGSAKHDWQITPRLSFKLDASVTTDDLVYSEYGDRLTDRSRQFAETNVFLSQRWDSFSLTANVLWYQDLTQPNPTELQRTPEIQFFGVRQPIPGLPGFLFETASSLTNFYRVLGDGGLRVDLHSRAYYPVPVAGLFTVTPFGGGRLTYYSQHVVGTFFSNAGVTVVETTYDPHLRRQIEGGFETETRVSRVFNMNGAGGLAALQHLIEPRATYLMIRGYDQKSNPEYERSIDRIGRVTQILYSLTNRLNAKTTAPTDAEAVRWEAVRVSLSSIYDIDRQISRREPFRDLQGEFIFDPNAILRFRADAAYNWYGLGFRQANMDLTARYRDVAVTLGSRYNAIAGANWVVGEVSSRILANLDGHVNTNWDVVEGTLVEGRVGFEWRFQCFSVMADYVHRRNNESEFRFAIGLLGIGQFGTKVGP